MSIESWCRTFEEKTKLKKSIKTKVWVNGHYEDIVHNGIPMKKWVSGYYKQVEDN